jgi:hypothetical protein
MIVLILLLVPWVGLRGIGAAGVQALASWQDSARYALVAYRGTKPASVQSPVRKVERLFRHQRCRDSRDPNGWTVRERPWRIL